MDELYTELESSSNQGNSYDDVGANSVWSQWIFITISLISLPLYFLTITVCIKEWKHNEEQRTFYMLIISEGIMDIIVVANYFIFWTFRVLHFFNDFYWNLQDTYLPAWCFNQNYIFAIMRCFGILIITYQRYLSMCKNRTRIEQVVNVTHRWILPVFQWILPILYSIPLFIINDVVFDSREQLEIFVKREQITLSTSMAAFFVCTTFILCSLCYGAILKLLVNNRYNNNVAMKREFRIYVQMTGLFVAFAALFVFNVMMLIFSLRENVRNVWCGYDFGRKISHTHTLIVKRTSHIGTILKFVVTTLEILIMPNLFCHLLSLSLIGVITCDKI
ncbi:hypothetical protein DICVIV_06690 [Dictyocaulus viviparus]|uniref:G-protein coupled receptors family 1 profile domain-containing protein n=1 Tax=Dictyocaulus viviparus TaxID=29172 RepID=A0A0D8XY14_DICVI|nr:hypothetical protein DICVIV_06690 [Dictyocaulus viviparus]